MPAKQYKWFMFTIPCRAWDPPTVLPGEFDFMVGQKEIGEETGYEHWQFTVGYKVKKTLYRVVQLWPREAHVEATRSSAANNYGLKDETAVPGTRFELGTLPVKRNSKADWDAVYELAKQGKWEEIPKDILIRSYSSLKRIYVDNLRPVGFEKEVFVFWGPTGTGKSHRAWSEAGLTAYPKDPMTKTWDGYQGEDNVVIEEYRGAINISHFLRWLDKYPVICDVKYTSNTLRCKRVWITSNLHPIKWYPELDGESREALMRRFTIVEHMSVRYHQ